MQETRTAVLKEAEIFGARVVDSSTEGFAIEATGDPEKLDEFIDVMRSYGEIEVTRSGVSRRVAGSQEAALAASRPNAGKIVSWRRLRRAGLQTRHFGRTKQEFSKMATRYYEKDDNPSDLQRPHRSHHRLWQPGPRARPQPARFRRRRGGRPTSRQPNRRAKAKAAGLKVMDTAEAAKAADVIMILVSDHIQGDRL